MSAPRSVRCPQCGTVVEWTDVSKFKPFCSKRCKEIDLGAWASGSYRIPAVDDDDDEEALGGDRDS